MNQLSKTTIAVISIFLIAASTLIETRAQTQARVGAYDPAHANGIVVIVGDQTFFGLRLLLYQQGSKVEAEPERLELGPCAADGSYARLGWISRFDEKTPVVLRWARLDQLSGDKPSGDKPSGDQSSSKAAPANSGQIIIVGSLTVPAAARLAIETYRPSATIRETGNSAIWNMFSPSADHRTILGEQVQKTNSSFQRFLLRTDRAANGAGAYPDSASLYSDLIKEGQAQTNEERPVNHRAALSFDLSQNQSVNFVLVVGDDFGAMEREAARISQRPFNDLLDQAGKNYAATAAGSSGAIGESFELISRAINWNRFYLFEKSTPEKLIEYVTINRNSGQPAQQNVLSWDAFFTGSIAAMIDQPAATATVRALLETQMPDGRLPLRSHLISSSPGEVATTRGRSMPPVGALGVWRTYLVTRDLELLAWAYPRLKAWNEWWFANRGDGKQWRDGNGDGLLEWGADIELEYGQLGAQTISNAAKQKLAFAESGIDDRPQWLNPASTSQPSAAAADSAPYNDQAHTLELTPVGLNSLYALDTEILKLIARELGLNEDADQWQTRYEQMRKLINEKLWSEQDGLYLNMHWDGKLSPRVSLENFYPLLAGIPEEERAKKLLAVLRDPKKFGGNFMLPSIARDDAAFDGASVGRGASWTLMNYLIYLGFKRYGFYEEAAELAGKSRAMTKANLAGDTFSPLDGSAINSSGTFAALALWPAIEELIATDPWTGLIFGSTVVKEESRIERLKLAGVKLDVISGPKRTVIRRANRVEIEVEAAARLRSYISNDRLITFNIDIKEQARLLVPSIEGRKITVSVDDKVLGSASAGASASFKVPAGSHKVLIVK